MVGFNSLSIFKGHPTYRGANMYHRLPGLSDTDLNRIHAATMSIFQKVGVRFHEPRAIELFKKHGIKVEGEVVFPTEAQIREALETAPSLFTVEARNRDKSITVGGDYYALAPGYGAPFVATPEGDQRPGTIADYENFCKLVQTSPALDSNGFLMINPSDVPLTTAYLDMLQASLTLSDKTFMGAPLSGTAADDSLEMAGLVFGSKESLRNRPVMIGNINTLSPLAYSDEMTGALMRFAEYGQPCLLSVAIMAGSTGPITLAGTLAVLNAEVLAGMLLSQLVNPGTPVVYGAISSSMDMRQGNFAFGAPELAALTSAGAQMARFYSLPSRGGGALTDAHCVDFQAGLESALGLSIPVLSGINFMFLSTGMLATAMSISFEKFLADEELILSLRTAIKPLDTSAESIGLEVIEAVGPGGQFLTHPETLRRCRTEFHIPVGSNRENHARWSDAGRLRMDEVLVGKVEERLASYECPSLGADLEKDLEKFVEARKSELN